MSVLDESSLTIDRVIERRDAPRLTERVIFAVRALYGLSHSSVDVPLGRGESFPSGQVCMSLDGDSDMAQNIGIVDFPRRRLKVRYCAQLVFPGLYDLVMSRRFDPSLLNPIRATATDECTVTEDYRGWRALGCLEFLPGSLWAGAHGG